MPYTLQNALVDLYTELGQLSVTTATGGATNTVVDSKQVGLHGDDAWLDGAAFLIRDAGGAGAGPEGEMARITGYTDSTGTFTSATSAWTIAPASGDTFGFTNNFYPLFTMMELVNRSLASIGEIPLVDTTTLTTASAQTEYTYALAWKRTPPYRVDLQTRTGDTNDNQWQQIHDWEYIPATANSTGLLVLRQLPVSRALRIWYRGVHPTLTAATSVIYEGYAEELVLATAVERALRWQNSRLQGGDDFLLQRWNDAKQELERVRALYTTWFPSAHSRGLILGAPRGRADRDFVINP